MAFIGNCQIVLFCIVLVFRPTYNLQCYIYDGIPHIIFLYIHHHHHHHKDGISHISGFLYSPSTPTCLLRSDGFQLDFRPFLFGTFTREPFETHQGIFTS